MRFITILPPLFWCWLAFLMIAYCAWGIGGVAVVAVFGLMLI